MANFVSNVQWNSNTLNSTLYSDNRTDFGSAQDGNFVLNGTSYPDRFFVEGDNGSANRILYAYGDFTVGAAGIPESGRYNALEEVDAGSGSTRWFIEGISVPVTDATQAANNGSFAALIEDNLAGNDTLTFSAFDDVGEAYGGDDVVKGGGGNDILDGGAGSDTAVFDGSFASATITFDGATAVVSTPADGIDRLTNFEFVNFAGDVRSIADLNGPPVPEAEAFSTTEDAADVTGQLSATDPNGGVLTFAVSGSGIAGLTLQSDGSYTFDPGNSAYQGLAAGEIAEFQTSYSVSDGSNSATSTITVTVTGVNDAPVIPEAIAFAADANAPFQFLSTATDVDGDTLAYSASDPANGTVTGGTGGLFTYQPDAGFVGEDTFTVTVSDGNGGADVQVVKITVSQAASAPQATPETASATEDGPVVTGQLEATDPDGDALTFSLLTGLSAPVVAGLTLAPDGSYSFDPGIEEYQSLAQGETRELTAQYSVTDGGFSDTSTITIVLTGTNDAPVFDPGATELETEAGLAVQFSATASDIDGDTLSYAAADPANGTVAMGADGVFTYTPDEGFSGTDTVNITVSDGNGGTDARTVTITVAGEPGDDIVLPDQRDFDLLLVAGFAGQIGGYGNVIGTAGFEDITVLDLPGAVVFDPSFNQGGGIVRLPGDASEWMVKQTGSSALFSDGDTFVLIPGGTAGLPVVFADGVRTLIIDQAAATFKIGDQAFGTDPVQVISETDATTLPEGEDADATAKLLFRPDGDATVGGNLDVFGTAGGETLTWLSGAGSLDPSFGSGGDSLILDDPAVEFLASAVGSNVFLDGDDTELVVPAGVAGLNLVFAGDDERLLAIDIGAGQIVIGDQPITGDATALISIG